MKMKWQKFFIAVGVFLLAMTVFHKYMDLMDKNNTVHMNVKEDTLSNFLDKVKNKKIQKILFKNERVIYESNNIVYKTYLPSTMEKDIINQIHNNNVPIKYEHEEVKTKGKKRMDSSLIINLISDLIFLIIFAFILRSSMSSSRGGGMMVMNKKNTPTKSDITFKDVAGIDAYRNEVMEVLDFLKNPQLYKKYGAKIPKGLLLCGAPGTGKTLIAKALAGEANVPFYNMAGPDFVEMFVGLGAARVRELFKAAGEHPNGAIIFIDEIDAIGASRKHNMMNSGNSEQMNTLNALLVEMDGFNTTNIIVIGATNRADVLDEALLRPGRFDRIINVPLPDLNGREKIINLVLSKIKMPHTIDSRVVARMTPSFSGADLTALINEGVLYAIKQRRGVLTLKTVEMARDKLLHGIADGKEHDMEEIICTAYHEAGHGVMAHHFKTLVEPIFKLTIESHGNALGFLSCFPDKDRMQTSKAKYLANIAVMLGGRVAEEIFFGEANVTSGASSDFKQATLLANDMVRKWGMSQSGILVMDIIRSNEEVHFISEEMKERLYLETTKIMDQAYSNVIKILKSYEHTIHSLVYYLITNGTLYKIDIENIMNGFYNLVGPLRSVNILNNQLLPTSSNLIRI